MARRIWIIAEKEAIEQEDIDAANLNNCPEIANGIPPALVGIVVPEDLPCVHVETPVAPEPPHEVHAAIIVSGPVSGLIFPVRTMRPWRGTEYFDDCYAAQSIMDTAGVGDYVVCAYDTGGEHVVVEKIFRSWASGQLRSGYL